MSKKSFGIRFLSIFQKELPEDTFDMKRSITWVILSCISLFPTMLSFLLFNFTLRCFDEDEDDLKPKKFKVRSFLIALGVQMFLSGLSTVFIVDDTFSSLNNFDILMIISSPAIFILTILSIVILFYFISYPFRKLWEIIDEKIIIYKDRRNRTFIVLLSRSKCVRTRNKSRFSAYREKRKQKKCKKIQYID